MKITKLAILFAVILGACADAFAQQTSEYVTWVRYVKTNPGRESDFIEMVKELNAETLDGLMADGTIISWGVAVPFTRRDPSWTHFLWISFADWADMDEVMASFVGADTERSKVEQAAIETRAREIVDRDGTRDLVVRHVVVPSGTAQEAPKGPPAYFRLSYYRVQPEHASAAVELYEEIAKPTYDDLVAQGEIADFALAEQELTSDPGWTHVSWQIFPDLGALDVMREARRKADEARSEQSQAEVMKKMMKYLDPHAYRSELCRIALLGGQ